MSQLLADKRRAKAAELAAERIAQDSTRTVSSPLPNSPSLQSGIPRSTSSTFASASRRAAPMNRAISSPQGSPGSPRPAHRAATKLTVSSPQNLVQRSRSSSLARTLSSSPPSSVDSPTSQSSPLWQNNTPSSGSGLRSPTASSATSGPNTLHTPTLTRKPLPSFSTEQPVSIDIYESPEVGVDPRSDRYTPTAVAGPIPLTPAQGVVDDALLSQAVQAVSAAQQLLEFAEDRPPSGLITPMRSTNGHQLKTPVNRNGLHGAWLDSPRNDAMTPAMLDKLRERKHERSWWLKRQQCEY